MKHHISDLKAFDSAVHELILLLNKYSVNGIQNDDGKETKQAETDVDMLKPQTS